MPVLSIELGSPASQDNMHAMPQTLTLFEEVNFTTYFFSRDKMPIDMNMLVFFLGKCVRTAANPMVVDRKRNRRH